VVATVVGVVLGAAVAGVPGQLGIELHDAFVDVLGAFTSAKSWLLIAAMLLAERFFPARPNQKIMSPNYVLDMFYMFVQGPVMVALAIVATAPLRGLLDEHAAWLVLDSTRALPGIVVVAIGLALADFIAWCAHVAMHKLAWLWRFHMIHHAQRELNLFTANRAHPVDIAFQVAVRFLPLYFFVPSITEQAETMLLYALAITWHIRFQHANIAWTLGPLRYVLVTPQSHRIHHSLDPEHWNSNYANVFTVWDRMFGTHNGDTTVRPATGIADGGVLEPASYRPDDLARAYVRQLVFPLTDAAASAGAVDASRTVLDANDDGQLTI
jgi:sterol desaturase/sphingolipid hydroxylase (fatty acid hydroxylase superfamily)